MMHDKSLDPPTADMVADTLMSYTESGFATCQSAEKPKYHRSTCIGCREESFTASSGGFGGGG